jgi:anaphase-promoting complex subunit 3
MGKRKEALEMYERACTLAPQSAAVHFKKVKLLVHLKKYKVRSTTPVRTAR